MDLQDNRRGPPREKKKSGHAHLICHARRINQSDRFELLIAIPVKAPKSTSVDNDKYVTVSLSSMTNSLV